MSKSKKKKEMVTPRLLLTLVVITVVLSVISSVVLISNVMDSGSLSSDPEYHTYGEVTLRVDNSVSEVSGKVTLDILGEVS